MTLKASGAARKIASTNIATGEHVYGRYGFAKLLKADGASIWQPDVGWCGGMSELRKIGALAEAYDIPVIPHNGGAKWRGALVDQPCQRALVGAVHAGARADPRRSTTCSRKSMK